MNQRCTFWLWASESPPAGHQCAKDAIVRGEAIGFCADHADRLITSLTPDVLKNARVTDLPAFMTRLGLTGAI